MKFEKGTPKPPNSGRKKGVLNKVTVSVKEALNQTFEGLGGVPALLAWAEKEERNRTEFYKLWIKMLPTEISGIDGAPVRLRIVEEIIDGDDDEGSAASPSPTTIPPV